MAYALFRISCMESPENGLPSIDVKTITSNIPASPARLDEIPIETVKKETLYHLKDIKHRGWPEYISECHEELRQLWTYREDLNVENSMILNGYRIIIPSTLREQVLKLIHQRHLGTKKCLL